MEKEKQDLRPLPIVNCFFIIKVIIEICRSLFPIKELNSEFMS